MEGRPEAGGQRVLYIQGFVSRVVWAAGLKGAGNRSKNGYSMDLQISEYQWVNGAEERDSQAL